MPYHKEKLRSKLEAVGKKSIGRITLDNVSMKGTHQIWPNILEGKLDSATVLCSAEYKGVCISTTYLIQGGVRIQGGVVCFRKTRIYKNTSIQFTWLFLIKGILLILNRMHICNFYLIYANLYIRQIRQYLPA